MCYTIKSIEDIRELVLRTRGLSGLLDLSFLVKKAAQALHPLLQTDVVAIFVVKDSIGNAEIAVQSVDGACTTGPDNVVQLEQRGLGGRILSGGEPFAASDFHSGSTLTSDFVEGILGREGVRGVAVVPLTFDSNVLGVLLCGNRTPGDVGQRVMSLLFEFSASVAPLIVTAMRAERAGEIAIQEERQRIAQQLHDTAGQILFHIGLSARQLQEKISADTSEAVTTIFDLAEEIASEASDASACLREALHSLLALSTEEALSVTVNRDARSFSRRTENHVEVIVVGNPFATSPVVDGTILCAVREALLNVEKHAGPASVVLTLSYRQGEIALLIQDDGKGLPPGFGVLPVPERADGLGLARLLRKVESLGGGLTVSGNEDGGFSLSVALPVPVL